MSNKDPRLPYLPRRIFVEKSVRDSLVTSNVLEALPKLPVELIDSREALLERYRPLRPTAPVAKRELILARQRGLFFKPCPGQQFRGDTANVCCDYFVVNFASNCHMECSYCYLQSYLNFPYMIVFANSEDLLAELTAVFRSRPEGSFRVGTGELADSLALDDLTGYGELLVNFFSNQHNAVLELKTKTDRVDRLLGLDHRERTVVAWSLNPPGIRESDEHKTATIDQRLRAAERCVEAGYPVAFHFDPIIHYEGWREDYGRLVDEIFDRIPPARIVWMSLGALRMTPELKLFMRKRFKGSRLPLGELVPSSDGKLRYVKPIRLELYRHLLSRISRRADPRTRLYACMERPEVWTRVFGGDPPSGEVIGRELSSRLVQLEVPNSLHGREP